MSATLEELGIDRLTVPERLDLIEAIWDSLPEQLTAEDVPDGHLPELSRRRDDANERPGEGKPWREVLNS